MKDVQCYELFGGIALRNDALFYTGYSNRLHPKTVDIELLLLLLLAQAPEDNPQKRWSDAWKADEFVHRMAMVAMVSSHEERRTS